MTRYGTALRARNPGRSDSKIHQVAVETAFGSAPAGTILPKEASATGFLVGGADPDDENAWKRECRKCP